MKFFLVAALFGPLAALPISAFALSKLPASEYIISQKGKQFGPREVTLRRGERLTIVNDDGNIVHHAFIEADQFSFDSGDQEPGARTIVTLPQSGDFTVLCGVHPKMTLAVHVL